MNPWRPVSILLAALLLPAALAHAQGAYPARPVKIVVGQPPGSATDSAARAVAQILGQALGQSFVVENKAGAGGIIATMQVVKSPADGYTLLMSSSGPLAVNPTLYSNLPYDPEKDLTPITVINSMPMYLVAHPAFTPGSVRDLIAFAKANPGKVSYGSSGVGITNHITMELFRSAAGIELTHVPYKGGPPALADLMGGQIPLMFETATGALPHVRSGRLKVLGVSSARRTAVTPDVPTIAESGLPGFEATAWVGLVAPAGTPPAIVERLHEVLAKGLRAPEVVAQFNALGSEPVGNTPREFTDFLKAEIAKWGKVVRDSGAKAE